jgi:hypothetical protein
MTVWPVHRSAMATPIPPVRISQATATTEPSSVVITTKDRGKLPGEGLADGSGTPGEGS